MKDVQLGIGGPPGTYAGADGWRAVTRVLRSCAAVAGTVACTTLHDLNSVVFPSDCRICGSAMVAFGRVRVCTACIERVGPPDAEAICARCGDALPMESARFAAAMGEVECSMCRLAPPEFERAVAFANYDNEMREMLHLLKFDGQRLMAEHVLGERMAVAVMKLREATANDLVVVPVPLFAAREKERGFNQSRLLAESAIKRLRRSAPQWKLMLELKALERVKDTRAMFTLDPGQRRRNLRGAFRVADAATVRDREVLLIDDIMTTGATARECSRVLRGAGATKVWVATAAKAQPVSAVAKFEAAEVAHWQPQPTARSVPLVEPDTGRRVRF